MCLRIELRGEVECLPGDFSVIMKRENARPGGKLRRWCADR
ncbi:hypothetical protein THTE_0467 [Thermogutta terrifontis]|uniref:Uncharacterized protein n=1 Tax=Thermogutta terrifontis TaxID=1331910 RepID=A0A286RAU6_9BACT|nr:hypothetical protein THTE_0467 [Thermogutta terrifontis]